MIESISQIHNSDLIRSQFRKCLNALNELSADAATYSDLVGHNGKHYLHVKTINARSC